MSAQEKAFENYWKEQCRGLSLLTSMSQEKSIFKNVFNAGLAAGRALENEECNRDFVEAMKVVDSIREKFLMQNPYEEITEIKEPRPTWLDVRATIFEFDDYIRQRQAKG